MIKWYNFFLKKTKILLCNWLILLWNSSLFAAASVSFVSDTQLPLRSNIPTSTNYIYYCYSAASLKQNKQNFKKITNSIPFNRNNWMEKIVRKKNGKQLITRIIMAKLFYATWYLYQVMEQALDFRHGLYTYA